MKTVKVKVRNVEITMDEEDVGLLKKHEYFFKKVNAQYSYIAREGFIRWKDGRQRIRVVPLSNDVCGVYSDQFKVRHLDGDSLNYVKSNLKVVHRGVFSVTDNMGTYKIRRNNGYAQIIVKIPSSDDIPGIRRALSKAFANIRSGTESIIRRGKV